MNEVLVGELAALITSVCWAFTGVFFTVSGRRVGSQTVNLARLALALIILSVAHRLTDGAWLPWQAEPYRWGWLTLSGVIGLTLGDASLFQALVYIGPRLSTLLMATVPLQSTILAWVLLGQRLEAMDLLAVPLTTAGVAWVVMERRSENGSASRGPKFRVGVLLGLGGALGQALGLITSRLGLEGDFSPISATLIRMLAATAALWGVSLLSGGGRRALASLRADRRALVIILGGTLVGPVLGVTLSLAAIQRAPIGIASTLMSLTPIAILPLVYFFFGERVSLSALSGTVVALAGVALIFLA